MERPDDEQVDTVLPSFNLHSSLSSVGLPFPEPANEDMWMERGRVNFNDAFPLRRSLSNDNNDLKQVEKVQLERYSLDKAVSDFANFPPPTNRRKTERTLSAPSLSGFPPIQSVEESWHNSFSMHHSKKDNPNDDGFSLYFENDLYVFKDNS